MEELLLGFGLLCLIGILASIGWIWEKIRGKIRGKRAPGYNYPDEDICILMKELVRTHLFKTIALIVSSVIITAAFRKWFNTDTEITFVIVLMFTSLIFIYLGKKLKR